MRDPSTPWRVTDEDPIECLLFLLVLQLQNLYLHEESTLLWNILLSEEERALRHDQSFLLPTLVEVDYEPPITMTLKKSNHSVMYQWNEPASRSVRLTVIRDVSCVVFLKIVNQCFCLVEEVWPTETINLNKKNKRAYMIMFSVISSLEQPALGKSPWLSWKSRRRLNALHWPSQHQSTRLTHTHTHLFDHWSFSVVFEGIVELLKGAARWDHKHSLIKLNQERTTNGSEKTIITQSLLHMSLDLDDRSIQNALRFVDTCRFTLGGKTRHGNALRSCLLPTYEPMQFVVDDRWETAKDSEPRKNDLLIPCQFENTHRPTVRKWSDPVELSRLSAVQIISRLFLADSACWTSSSFVQNPTVCASSCQTCSQSVTNHRIWRPCCWSSTVSVCLNSLRSLSRFSYSSRKGTPKRNLRHLYQQLDLAEKANMLVSVPRTNESP